MSTDSAKPQVWAAAGLGDDKRGLSAPDRASDVVAMPRPDNEELSKNLVRVFKRMIARDQLRPGGKIPSERELAPKLGVSRGSLRESLKVLETLGVIRQRVGDGSYLAEDNGGVLSGPLSYLILLDEISYDELVETRLVVEPSLAAMAAERADEAQIARLRENVAEMMCRTGKTETVSELDLEFHGLVFEAARNRVCHSVFGGINHALRASLTHTTPLATAQDVALSHKRIVDAIEQHDSHGAREAMSDHIVWGRELIGGMDSFTHDPAGDGIDDIESASRSAA